MGAPSVSPSIIVDGLTNGDYFEMDAVFFMPVDKGLFVSKWLNGHVGLFVDGPRNSVYSAVVAASDYIGQPFDLLPGQVMNRIRLLQYYSADDERFLTHNFAVTLTVTPRTRHLLGAT